MTDIVDRIIKNAQKAEFIEEGVLGRIHHAMNMRYGFVPISELVNMPMYAILTLLDYIERDLIEEKKMLDKSQGNRGIRKRLG